MTEAVGITTSTGGGVSAAGAVVVATVGTDAGDIAALIIKVLIRLILFAAILVAIINMVKKQIKCRNKTPLPLCIIIKNFI